MRGAWIAFTLAVCGCNHEPLVPAPADMALGVQSGIDASAPPPDFALVDVAMPPFANPVMYPVMNINTRRSIVTADLNGDGILDLATATDASIAVLFGDGKGAFQPATIIQVGPNPDAVAVGDFDEDGAIDLVASDHGGFLVVLLNRGDGTFLPTSYPLYPMSQPESVAVGDVDGDGHGDIVCANDYTVDPFVMAVQVLKGRGDGTLDAPSPYSIDDGPDGFPCAIAVGDLDGMPGADVVTGNQDSADHVSVLLSGQNGNLRAATGYAAGPTNSLGIVLGDLDNDGTQDVVAANITPGGATVLLGDGTGHLSPGTFFPIPLRSPIGVAAADFDRDGNTDVAVTLYEGQTIILHGDGHGALGRPFELAVGPVPWGLAAGDFNRDGWPDLAVACAGGISILLSTH